MLLRGFLGTAIVFAGCGLVNRLAQGSWPDANFSWMLLVIAGVGGGVPLALSEPVERWVARRQPRAGAAAVVSYLATLAAVTAPALIVLIDLILRHRSLAGAIDHLRHTEPEALALLIGFPLPFVAALLARAGRIGKWIRASLFAAGLAAILAGAPDHSRIFSLA